MIYDAKENMHNNSAAKTAVVYLMLMKNSSQTNSPTLAKSLCRFSLQHSWGSPSRQKGQDKKHTPCDYLRLSLRQTPGSMFTHGENDETSQPLSPYLKLVTRNTQIRWDYSRMNTSN